MSKVLLCQTALPAMGFRSTVVVTGIGILRARGLFEAYQAALSPRARDAILGSVAGTWLDTDLTMEHFAAVDSLGLTTEQAYAIGAASGQRFGATMWGTLLRVAARTASSPWTVLGAYDRIFARSFDGGGFSVLEDGPKDATVELLSIPFAKYAYFRAACCGAHHSMLGLFAKTVHVTEVPKLANAMRFVIRVAWV